MPRQTDVTPLYDEAGGALNVDPMLLRAISQVESGGEKDPDRAVSSAGAAGRMQVMPENLQRFKVSDPADPRQNIYAGAAVFDEALTAANGNVPLALRIYQGGQDQSKWGPNNAAYPGKVAAAYQALAQRPQAGHAAAAAPKGPDATDAFLSGATPGGGGKAAAAPDATDAFLAGKEDTAAAAEPAAAPAAPVDTHFSDGGGNEYGITGDPQQFNAQTPGPATTAIGRIGEAGAKGAVEGFGNPLGHTILSPEAQAKLDEIQRQGGFKGLLAGLGSTVATDIGTGLGVAGGVGNALLRGAQGIVAQTGAETGQPQLGRDIAALPEAFMGSPNMLERPGPAGAHPLDPPRPSRAIVAEMTPAQREAFANSLAPRPGDPIVRPNALLRGPDSGPLPPSVDLTPSTGMGSPTSSPGAVGADITTAPIPEKTPAQRIADLEKSVQQTAEERAGPQLRDATPYVEGIPPRVRASSEFTPANALDHKVAIAADPAYRAEVEATTRERNNGMVDLLRSDASDENGLIRAHDYRDEVKPGPLGVFDEQKPVDASGLVDTINGLLRGQEGKQAAVRNTLKSVLDSLHDQDGNVETLPSMLYGARKNLTDLLKKGVKGVGDMADDVRASKPILMGLLPDFDKTISEGAPKFSTEYLPQFHERSLPIDQMEFLQKYQTGAKKITDGDGYLQPNKVQKMLDDVLQGLKAPGVNAAKSLTDQQIQAIINVRNELFADKLRDRMASVRGSDSFQQINRAITPTDTPAKAALKGAAVWGAHGAMMATPAAGWGNALMGGYQAIVRPAVKAAQERKAAEAIAARKNYLLTPLPPENP